MSLHSFDDHDDDGNDDGSATETTVDALMKLVTTAPPQRGGGSARVVAPLPRARATADRMPGWLRLIGIALRHEAQRR